MAARIPDSEPGAPETPEEAKRRRNRERAREWRAKNPEKVRESWRRNQARWRENHIALRRDLEDGADPEAALHTLEGKFTPGFNQRNNITHGAKDSQRVAILATAIREALLNNPSVDDHLSEPQFEYAVLAWSQAEAQVQLIRAYIDACGLSEAMTETIETEETESGDGPTVGSSQSVTRHSVSRKAASLMGELHKAEVRAGNFRKELGLTPLARARLGKDVNKARAHLIQIWDELPAEDEARALEAGKDDDAQAS